VRAIVPTYTPRPSAMHATRASVGAAYCASLALVPILFENPIVLAAAGCAVLAAAVAAGVASELRRFAQLSVPLVLLIVLVNALVSGQGDTLLVRGEELLGKRWGDVTLEAIAFGAVMGLRLMVLILALGLLSAAVDPDELLRLFRRVSYRSALTASLATRLVPVLQRDAARMSDAARCRPESPGRAAVARAALLGALDRAIDVAAALEVRGYAGARRPTRLPRPWSRHDLRFGASAIMIAAASIAAALAGIGSFVAYPRPEVAAGAPEGALAVAILALAAAPFATPGARLGVARG
jgi:energy-coupling factor transport system permease protein